MPVSLHFMYDHTSLNENGLNDVVVIPHKEMVNFIRFTIGGASLSVPSHRLISGSERPASRDYRRGFQRRSRARGPYRPPDLCHRGFAADMLSGFGLYSQRLFLREVPEPENNKK